MKAPKKFVRSLRSLISTGYVMELDRSPMTTDRLWGFVIYVNRRFLLLNVVDDSYRMNGFSIVRTNDVKRYRVHKERKAMIRYVLSKRYPEGYLKSPTVELGEMKDLSFLESIGEGYPLITIHREKVDDTVCYIGRVKRLKSKTFTLHTIDTVAAWDDVRRFRHKDVTRIDFGGTYEDALWMYAQVADQQESV